MLAGAPKAASFLRMLEMCTQSTLMLTSLSQPQMWVSTLSALMIMPAWFMKNSTIWYSFALSDRRSLPALSSNVERSSTSPQASSRSGV